MPIIGKFKEKHGGFAGVVSTLTFKAAIEFDMLTNPSHDPKTPSYRITAGGLEVGAAWRKFSRLDQREYFHCKIDDPTFAEPIYGSLVAAGAEDSREYLLLWSRRQSKT